MAMNYCITVWCVLYNSYMYVIVIYDTYIYAYKYSYIYISICYDEAKYGTVIHETVRTIYGTYMHLQGLYIKHCPSYMNMPYMMELIWINVEDMYLPYMRTYETCMK